MKLNLAGLVMKVLNLKLFKYGWKLIFFLYLEYRVARENTLLMRYNIQQSYVQIQRLSEQGTNQLFQLITFGVILL